MNHFIPKIAALFAAGLFSVAQASPSDHAGPRFGGGMLMQLGKLKSQLTLTSAQQALWDDAETASKAARVLNQDQRQKTQTAIAAEIAKDTIDLRAIDQLMETARANGSKQQAMAREKWLTAYDSLTTEQKRQASKLIQARVQQFEQKRADGGHRKHVDATAN